MSRLHYLKKCIIKKKFRILNKDSPQLSDYIDTMSYYPGCSVTSSNKSFQVFLFPVEHPHAGTGAEDTPGEMFS